MSKQSEQIMELVRMHGAAWYASGCHQSTPSEASRYEAIAVGRRAEIEAALLEPESSATLTDEQIDAVFNQMPDGASGFLKTWGYRQFARSLLEAAATTGTQPTQNEHANRRLTHMVDAAMTEMANVYPPLRRSECQRLIHAAMAAEATAVEAVKLVIRDYHYGLDTRKNGNLIAGQAVSAIQVALGMEWIQGAEATRRSQTGNT